MPPLRAALRRRDNQMKKRMFVCFLIFMGSVFHLSIPKIVFGQQSPAQQVFNRYEKTLLKREDVQKLFPGFLRIFKRQDLQSALNPNLIEIILSNPLSYQELDPGIDNQFLLLLSTDDELRTLFRDNQFYTVFSDPKKIEEFAKLIEKEGARKPVVIEIALGDNQQGESGNSLQPFVVIVKNIYGGAPSDVVNVTFAVTLRNGKLSPTRTKTDPGGKAETTLTLGPDPGIYQVEASVDDYPELKQTFTAAAIGSGNGGGDEQRATKLEIISGDDQSGKVGMSLAQPFVVGVLDQNGKALVDKSVDVTFSVIRGSGSFPNVKTTETVKTDPYGQASVRFRLGSNVGIILVRATLETITGEKTVIFSVTAKSGTLPEVYWIESGAIFRFDGRSRDELDIPFSMGWRPTSLAVDMIRGKLYWTERQGDQQKGRIRSANLNGKNPEVLRLGKNDSIKAVLEGIVVDTKNGWLYWTNSRGKIQSIKVNGKGFNGGLIKGLGSPKHIALGLDGDADTASGTLYWTVYDEAEKSGSIWYKRLGDSGVREKEPLTGLGKLSGIAVDGNKLYWTEEIDGAQGKISSAYHNGAGNKTLSYVPGSVPLGLAVDGDGRRLYWTDTDGNIQSLNLNNPVEIVVLGSNTPAVAIALGRPSVRAAPVSPAAPSTIVERSEQNALLANYPNPFNPETWIPYQLSEATDVTVSIYSVNGQLVRHLDLGHQTAGVYHSRSRAAYWNGRNAFGERVASGLYFYTLTAGDFTATRKMLIRK